MPFTRIPILSGCTNEFWKSDMAIPVRALAEATASDVALAEYRKVLADHHEEKKADVTIAFTAVPLEGPHRFGQGQIKDEERRGGEVLHYIEKPKKSLYDWASLTIYVFRTDVLLEALGANVRKESHEFGKDIIPSLLGNFRVYGYKHQGYWGYARSLEEYWQTSMDLLGDNPRINLRSWGIRTNLAHREIRDRQPSILGPSAIVDDCLFYSGSRIEGRVSRSLLFPGAVVEKDAVVEDSVLFFDTTVGREARVSRTIADIGVRIGPRSRIGDPGGELSVIGAESFIPQGVRIGPGVTVYPGVEAGRFTRTDYETGEIIK